MTAKVLQFGSVGNIRRIKELEAQLGEAHDALLRAKDVILELQKEQKYREFYQWLATSRLSETIALRKELQDGRK